MIRSFIALKLSHQVIQELAINVDIIKSLDKHEEIRWVSTDNYHLTLCFLGDLEPELLELLKLSLSEKTLGLGHIRLSLTDVSFFPFTDKLRIVAGIITPSDSLRGLKTRVDQAARSISIPVKKRGFKPHITLGRVKGRFTPKLKIHPRSVMLSCDATELIVFQSRLTPKGACYKSLFEIPLI